MTNAQSTSQVIAITENGLHLVLEITTEQDIRLLHFSPLPYADRHLREADKQVFRLLELQITGENQNDIHGSRYVTTAPANRMRYVTHRDYRTDLGRKLEIEQQADGVVAISHLQFIDGMSIVQSWTEVRNEGRAPVGIEYVSSFSLTGIAKEAQAGWGTTSRLHIPHNTWCGEAQWRTNTLDELGLIPAFHGSLRRLSYAVTGNWPSEGYLPMAVYENTETGTTLFWQIEAPGSWHWEMAVQWKHLYLKLSGPTENENHWWKHVQPGQAFSTVSVAVGSLVGDFTRAIGELTRYRRATRRPNADNDNLPVIFNDYMNCLSGDPTTAKLLPLIDAAAEVGCEYFCIDCGWYSEGPWWDGVGEWLPAAQRFPGGIKEPLDYIRAKGMVPGLWLELEVMGINCPKAQRVPSEWFFMRHGTPIITHSRYQLDYRNPEVIAHADEVIDRLVNDYGVGYIKMDYNINAGPGTDRAADSAGDGLLEHNRAYLAWLDRVFARYPNLIIENCGSGGMRMTYAYLNRLSIQSTSDQGDYRLYAAIVAAAPTAVTPEQAAVWSYPLQNGDREEVIFNMVNAMLLRIHQSGHLAEISAVRKALVREGIACYKEIRQDLKDGLAFWPLGIPHAGNGWISLGMRCGARTYVAVWRLADNAKTCTLPIDFLRGKDVAVTMGYPQEGGDPYRWHPESGKLVVTLPTPYSARLFRFECTEETAINSYIDHRGI